MKKENKIIVGIDPDYTKSGVAFIDKSKINNILPKFYMIELSNLDFYDLIDYLIFVHKQALEQSFDIVVVIEQGEQNKALFNAKNSKTKAISAKIGAGIGKNFAISKLLVEFCERNGINHRIYVPKSNKWDAKFVKKMFGIIERTNQDNRDALRCAVSFI